MHSRRRTTWLLAATLLLACLGVLLASEAGHTDDGCQVELHCLACRAAFAGVALAAIQLALLPAFASRPVALPARRSSRASIRARAATPRGPPAVLFQP